MSSSFSISTGCFEHDVTVIAPVKVNRITTGRECSEITLAWKQIWPGRNDR